VESANQRGVIIPPRIRRERNERLFATRYCVLRVTMVNGRYVGFTLMWERSYVGFLPGRRGVRSEPDLYAGLKERSKVCNKT